MTKEIRKCPPFDVGAKAHRSPEVHGFDTPTIIDRQERITIIQQDRSSGRNEGAVGEFDSVAPDVSRSRVFDLGRQSAGSDRQVGANSCVEELTLAEVPGAIHVV
ncbi:MAG: hypothetical protein DMG12_26465 [Acidobacteria bacterium]|nr:MAG: hypothetical protein DMG12_26465 [Acidobacteriota bacterium]